jgi:hypothetical protein
MALENVDPRIIGNIQQPNYLQGIGQVAQVSNALLGAQAQKQQIQANLATSEAFKQATNPETGQTDWNQLRGLVAQGPAAYNLPQINQAITQNQVSQQQLEAGRFDLAMKKQGAIADQLGSLVNLGPNLKKDDVVNKVTELVQNNVLPLDQALQQLGSMPQDAAGLQQWVKQHAFTALKGMERMQAMNPQVMAVNNGAGTTLINTNMMSSAPYGVIGNVQAQLSPGELAQEVTITGPNGEPIKVTKAQFLQMTGQGGQGGQGGGEGYTGRYGAGQAQTSGIPGGVSAGLGPSQSAALGVQGQAAAKEAASLSEGAASSPTRINLLKQAQAALQNPNVQTGPGTDWRNMAKSFFGALAPDVAKALGTAENVKDADEFKKVMNQYANQASAGMGTGTNDRLNIALVGNANPEISKMANEDILKKTIAVEKMNQAKNYAWQNSGLADTNPQKYQQWSSQWNKTVNPDVFIADELTPDQQAKMFKKMSPKDLAKFKQDYATAYQAGLVGR